MKNDYKSGDLVFCTTTGIIGKGIRWGQRRLPDNKYSKYNHVAILDRPCGDDWFVIQAEPHGVTDDKLLSAFTGTSEVVKLPRTTNRSEMLRFARSQVGLKYGYLSILSCAIDAFLPNSICVRKSGTWICSALVAASMWFGNFPDAVEIPDLYSITPAEIRHLCTGY